MVPTLTCGLVRSNLPFAIFFDSEKSNDHSVQTRVQPLGLHPWILVPLAGIGPATSPLPRECSTTEPQGRNSWPSTGDSKSPPRRRPVERETGIEPASLAWKAKVLPLNYSRIGRAQWALAAPARD